MKLCRIGVKLCSPPESFFCTVLIRVMLLHYQLLSASNGFSPSRMNRGRTFHKTFKRICCVIIVYYLLRVSRVTFGEASGGFFEDLKTSKRQNVTMSPFFCNFSWNIYFILLIISVFNPFSSLVKMCLLSWVIAATSYASSVVKTAVRWLDRTVCLSGLFKG